MHNQWHSVQWVSGDRQETQPEGSLLARGCAYTIALCGLLLLWLFLAWDRTSYRVYEAKHPTGLGAARFVQENGFLDSHMDLYIIDSRISQRPFLATNVDSATWSEAYDAVWTRDGSVLAVRTEHYNRDTGQSRIIYTCAYDFLSHTTLPSQADLFPNS